MPDIGQMEKRQQALADFGEFALRSDDLDAVLTRACRLIADALGTGHAKVLEIEHERGTLFVRAGVGWDEGVVGRLRLPMGEHSSETYSVERGEPVITNDLASESRFDFPAFLKDAGVQALANVPIFLPGGRPFGLLQVDASEPRAFGDADSQFLRTYATILGPVIDRLLKVQRLSATEEALRENEARHRLLQAAWEADGSGLVVADSPSWRAYTGQTLEEWLGYGWLDAVHPDDRAYAERQWREAVTVHGLVDAEFRLRSPDGGWRWTNIRAAPVLDPGGRIEKWVGINVDIDARKRAEAALRESEERGAFLLGLADALRPLADPPEIIRVAVRRLREAVGASRAYYAEWPRGVDYCEIWGDDAAPGLPSLVGRYPNDAFRLIYDRIRDGRTWVVEDVADGTFAAAERDYCLAHGVASWVDVPLVKAGELQAALFVVEDRARRWTVTETALAEETAERTWAAVERAHAERELRESEERGAFLLELSDALRPLADAREIQATTTRLLGEHLGADRSMYAEVTGEPGTERGVIRGQFIRPAAPGRPSPAPFPDHFSYETFGAEVMARRYSGEGLAVADVNADPGFDETERAAWAAVGVQAAIVAPLVKDGRLVAELGVHSGTPRAWTDAEVSLVHEVGERTWAAAERARAEAALAASEDKHRTLFETMGQGYSELELVRDAQGQAVDQLYLELNPAFERLFGTPVAAARGRTASALFPDLDPVWTQHFANVVATGEPQRIEHRFGSDRWFEAVAYPRQNDRVAVLYEEVTDRKRAERALRAGEERFRLLLESVRDYAIFTTDRDGLITSWPSGAAAVYGWSEQEMLGRSVDLTFLPEDVASGAPRDERDTAARTGLAPNVRWHQRKDGARIFIEGSTQPLVGADGQIREFIKIGQDVTEVRRTQQALAEGEQRLRTLMEGIPQLVWRSCDEGRWTWSSPQWQAFTGQSPVESLALGWLDAIHPDDHDATMRAWEAARPHGRLDVEYRVRRAADGAYLWHHTRSVPVRDEAGRLLEWLGTTTDVQQLKELQERQEVMVAELQHRTRNLIAVVRSIAQQTMEQTGPTERFREEFNHRLEALARVQGLLSRSDEEPITMDGLIHMELDALGARAEPGRLDVDGPSVRVRHSVVQTLALALHELATNARKYGALSNSDGRLTVTWRTYGEGRGERLALQWAERGGQPPSNNGDAPRGYGRELIERALPYSLNAKTSFEHDEAGLRCTIDMPLERTRSRRRST
ncbi:PAS domain S-box protein [Roseomonas sp. KE2513]|uniref:PAS domain S-box protein n=1 Tax=Roseomonas sp. KE2513 TaxID=2479202 RepID=UPI0018DF9D38|nr:PAS domain S-box protein [Roseomonas sp. KE2513]MBI0538525.1 PAS domain S-box protein [Roseomonas sp. KE2513]